MLYLYGLCCKYSKLISSTESPVQLGNMISIFQDQKFYFRIANVRNFPRGMPPCRPLHEPLFTPAPSPYPSWHIYSTDCWTNVHWNKEDPALPARIVALPMMGKVVLSGCSITHETNKAHMAILLGPVNYLVLLCLESETNRTSGQQHSLKYQSTIRC